MKDSGFFSEKELSELGIKFGKNVLISRKTSIYCSDLEIGDNVRIDDFCILTGKIKIGSHVHICSFSQLSGGSGIVMEDFTGTGSRSLLYSQSDDFSGLYLVGPLFDSKLTNVTKGTIYLKNHASVGPGSIVLPGVTISEGTVISLLSLIKKDTLPWKIYFGVPAKPIRNRKQNVLELEQTFLRDYDNK
ncbi:MAG: acyltransferase [Acidobacteriota bacterium]|jgi:galactoside O-acetyltransferase|nr:acyltransferase [Acidobacteriota bacterium]